MRIEQRIIINGTDVIGLEGLKKLADAGDIDALNLLGECLLMGFECSIDEHYSKECFEKAARKGLPKAMRNLSVCYKEGHGVEKDFYAAERWARAALECGDEYAEKLCNEIYLQTIGGHKPNIKDYVDFLYYIKKKNDDIEDNDAEKEKQRILESVILENSKKDVETYREKITEEDIATFLRVNDLNFEEPEITKELSDKERRSVIDGAFEKCDKSNVRDVAFLCKLLAVVGEDIQDDEYKALKDIYRACTGGSKLKKRLSWVEKASIDFVPELKENTCVSGYLLNLKKIYDDLQDTDFEGKYSNAQNSLQSLRILRQEVSISELYLDTKKKEYDARLNNDIKEAEDRLLEKEYSKAQEDYDSLFDLYEDIRNNHAPYDSYIEESKKKWLELLPGKIRLLQEKKLQELTNQIEANSYNELVNKRVTAQHYNFDRELCDEYADIIEQRINHLEIEELEKRCSNLEGRSSIEYRNLMKAIRSLGFKDANVRPYLQKIQVLFEEKDLDERYNSAQNSYDELLDYYRFAETSGYETSIKQKWLAISSKALIALQEKELIHLIDGIDSATHTDLLERKSKMQKYSFDSSVLQKYEKQVDARIDEIEIRDISRLCEGYEELSSEETRQLISNIKATGYKEEHTTEAINNAERHLKNVLLTESCTEDKLELMDMDELNQKISDIHFSELANEKKSSLSKSIKHYIELIEDCNDKRTLDLLEKCETKHLDQAVLPELKDLRARIADHQRLPSEERSRILGEIDDKIVPIETFYDSFVKREKVGLIKYSSEDIKNAKEMLVKTGASKSELDRYHKSLAFQELYLGVDDNDSSRLLELYRDIIKYVDGEAKEAYGNAIRTKYYTCVADKLLPLKEASCAGELLFAGMGTTAANDALFKKSIEYITQVYRFKDIPIVYYSNTFSFVMSYEYLYFNKHVVPMADIYNLVYEKKLFNIQLYVIDSNNRKILLIDTRERTVAEESYKAFSRAFEAVTGKKLGQETNSAPKVSEAEEPQMTNSSNAQGIKAIPVGAIWKCSCGQINKAKFCTKCGNSKENGVPLWMCDCGALNKGKFCVKCGKVKEEAQ